MYSQPYPQPPYVQAHPQFQPGAVPMSSQSPPEMAAPVPHPQPQPQPKLFQDGSAPVFRACSSAMQRPTLTNVRIRSTRDANQIFYAVLRNLLPMTVRRLDAEERRAITSGNVYVWEERGASSEATGLGIERWTDGMRWSPSRVRDEFLFYHQKELDPEEADNLPPTRWARIVKPKTSSADGSSSDTSPDKIPHQRPLNDPEKLIKQTYSVLVALPEDSQRGVLRKWHLTAYFTQSTVDKLQTVDEVLPKPHAMIPEGLFRSARAGKVRRDTASSRLQQQQQQQRQLAYYDHPDPAGPSGSSPVSATAYQTPSASYSPYGPSYAHMTPHAYAYSHHAQPQYSPYVQDEGAVHRHALPPPPSLPLPPAGGPYTITPAPHHPHFHSPPPPPPPPQGQSTISGHPRAAGLGITYSRPLREWDDEREREYDREPREQMRYERDLEHERASNSPQRLPSALPLPNTFDPTRGRAAAIHPVASSSSSSTSAAVPVVAPPMQIRPSSYPPHPYANALQTHLVRTSGGAVAASTPQAPVSEYYSPAKPIKPIDVSSSRPAQVALAQSTTSPTTELAGTSKNNADCMETDERNDNNDTTEPSEEIGAIVVGEQRESAIGPARIGLSHSPRHSSNSHRLPSATRLSASPRSMPSSTLSAVALARPASDSGLDPAPRLRSASFSGSMGTMTRTGPITAGALASLAAEADHDQVDQGRAGVTPNRSPMSGSGKLSLDEERVRSLVPLQSLENAVFPRRDPTDDALLRRFNALRTTPPTSTARDE